MKFNNHNLTGQNKKHSTAAGRRISKAVVETLEARQLMASSASLIDGTLTITGNDSINNYMSVRLSEDGETVAVQANTKTRTFARADVDAIQITGTERGDIVRVDPRLSMPLDVKTFGGNDSVGTDGRAIHDGDVRYDARAGRNVVLNKTAGPRIASFTLINADTDEVIAEYKNLGDGMTVNLADLPTKNLNIRANVINGNGGSVKFAFEGETNLENIAHYTMAGNDKNDYHAWTPATGEFKLSATPYTYNNAHGVKGQTKTITLNFTNSATPTNNKPTPKPAPKPAPKPEPTDRPEKPGPDNTGEVGAPVPVIASISRTVQAGHAIHVNAIATILRNGDPLTAKYEWNFGDAGSKWDDLSGFNAAHSYDKPGTYTVTLRVTDAAGKVAVATTQVTIAASTRRVIYVSNSGNDSNSGTSPNDAIKSWAKATSMVTDNTEILFRRGDSWTVSKTMSVGKRNVVIGSYGAGERPLLNYHGALNYTAVLSTRGGTDVTIRDLAFDSKDAGHEGYYHGVAAGGTNTTVRGCEFLNVGYAINANGRPTGLLLQENTANSGGLRSYFLFAQGADVVLVGNDAMLPGDRGHVVRIDGTDRINVVSNTFTKGPVDKTCRGTITAHHGSYMHIAENTLTGGKFTVGPLGEGDGLVAKYRRINWVVADGNRIESSVIVEHGTQHVMFRNNVVNRDRNFAFQVEAFDSTYGRGVIDARFDRNTAVNNGTSGNFLHVMGDVDGIQVTNNVYVAPNLVTGSHRASPVRVDDSNLSSFEEISGNVWPAANPGSSTGGGINLVGTSVNASTYRTPSEWEALPEVNGDTFKDVVLTNTHQLAIHGTMAGSTLKAA